MADDGQRQRLVEIRTTGYSSGSGRLQSLQAAPVAYRARVGPAARLRPAVVEASRLPPRAAGESPLSRGGGLEYLSDRLAGHQPGSASKGLTVLEGAGGMSAGWPAGSDLHRDDLPHLGRTTSPAERARRLKGHGSMFDAPRGLTEYGMPFGGTERHADSASPITAAVAAATITVANAMLDAEMELHWEAARKSSRWGATGGRDLWIEGPAGGFEYKPPKKAAEEATPSHFNIAGAIEDAKKAINAWYAKNFGGSETLEGGSEGFGGAKGWGRYSWKEWQEVEKALASEVLGWKPSRRGGDPPMVSMAHTSQPADVELEPAASGCAFVMLAEGTAGKAALTPLRGKQRDPGWIDPEPDLAYGLPPETFPLRAKPRDILPDPLW